MTKHNNQGNYNKGGHPQKHTQHNPNQQNVRPVMSIEEMKKAFVAPEEENMFKGLVLTQQKIQQAIVKSFNNLLGYKDACVGAYLDHVDTKDENFQWKFRVIIDADSPIFQKGGQGRSNKSMNRMQQFLVSSVASTSVRLADGFKDLMNYLRYFNPYERGRDGKFKEMDTHNINVSFTKNLGNKRYHFVDIDFYKIVALLLGVSYESVRIYQEEDVPTVGKKKKRGTQKAFAILIYTSDIEIADTSINEEIVEDLVEALKRGEDPDSIDEDDEDDYDDDEDDDDLL